MNICKNTGCNCSEGGGIVPTNPKDIHNIHDKNIMDRFRSAVHRVREIVKCRQKDGYIEDSMNISFISAMSEKNPTTKMFRNWLLDANKKFKEKIFEEFLVIFDDVFSEYIKEMNFMKPITSRVDEYKRYYVTKQGEEVLAFRVKLRNIITVRKPKSKENRSLNRYLTDISCFYRFATIETTSLKIIRDKLNDPTRAFMRPTDDISLTVVRDLIDVIEEIERVGAKTFMKDYLEEIYKEIFYEYCSTDAGLAKLWSDAYLPNSTDKKEVKFDKTQNNQFRFLPHPDCCVFNKNNYTHSLSIKIAEDGKFQVRKALEKWREFIQKNQTPLDVYPVSIGFKDIDKAQKWIDEFSNVSFKVNFKFDDDIPKSLTIQEIARLIGTDVFLYTVTKDWLDRTDMKKALRLEFDREGTTSLITRFTDVHGENHDASEDIEYAYTDVNKATEAFKKLQRLK